MFEILRDVDGCPVSIFGQKPVVSIQSRVDMNLSIETAQQFRSALKVQLAREQEKHMG